MQNFLKLNDWELYTIYMAASFARQYNHLASDVDIFVKNEQYPLNTKLLEKYVDSVSTIIITMNSFSRSISFVDSIAYDCGFFEIQDAAEKLSVELKSFRNG